MKNIKSICVYCGSSDGNNPLYLKAARNFGHMLAEKNIRLVYGGGGSGIMGEIANSVLKNGGHVTGIIPDFLTKIEKTLSNTSKLIITDNMHTRKELMFEKSDALVALPGGIGTLEEIIEVLTWAQLSLHTKPVVLVSVNDYWKSLLDLFNHIDNEGFMTFKLKPNFQVIDKIENIFEAITIAQKEIIKYENGVGGID